MNREWNVRVETNSLLTAPLAAGVCPHPFLKPKRQVERHGLCPPRLSGRNHSKRCVSRKRTTSGFFCSLKHGCAAREGPGTSPRGSALSASPARGHGHGGKSTFEKYLDSARASAS